MRINKLPPAMNRRDGEPTSNIEPLVLSVIVLITVLLVLFSRAEARPHQSCSDDPKSGIVSLQVGAGTSIQFDEEFCTPGQHVLITSPITPNHYQQVGGSANHTHAVILLAGDVSDTSTVVIQWRAEVATQ